MLDSTPVRDDEILIASEEREQLLGRKMRIGKWEADYK
jgi:hypothetical protein